MCAGQMEMGKDGGQQARAGRQEEGEVPTESPWLKLGVSAGCQSLLWGGQQGRIREGYALCWQTPSVILGA